MNKNVVGYVRVSTERQEKKGMSIQNQTEKIKEYCSLMDLSLDEIIVEVKSGKDDNRVGYNRVLDMVKDKSIDGVVVYSLSRWGRNITDNWNSISLMEKRNINFFSIKESIDTSNSMGRFFLNIMSSLYQLEREQLSERISDVLQYKKSKNQVFGMIPYGYDRKENDLVENPTEMKMVRKIKSLKGKGFNVSQITKYLNRNNYKPKRGKEFYRSGVSYLLNYSLT